MVQKMLGGQRDFSYGEVDPDLKRNDDHPARKGGLRQMANARIRNSGAIQNRSGRRALYRALDGDLRTERITLSAGHDFDIQFAPGLLKIIDSSGTVVGRFANQGGGAAIPWVSQSDINSIVYAALNLSIYVTFGHAMRPQVVSWDGVSIWSIADYTELMQGSQKRTPFYRISQQGIFIIPSAQSGAITILASAPVFTAAMVGTRIRFVGRQILITAFTDSTHISGTVQETLPGSQVINFASSPLTVIATGDVVIGSVSGSEGVVTNTSGTNITVQLLRTSSTSFTSISGQVNVVAFVGSDIVAGPGGSIAASSANSIGPPSGCAVWDDEVMNTLRGYPASCFVDQFRLGFCDFPSVPGGIGWSAINSPTDLYAGPNPADAMFEVAPSKVRVLYVQGGPESSEFVFCDRRVYYIPISPTNPLKTGSVSFQVLSGDGSAPVQPRLAQEAILYINAGQNSVMAIIASGAYYRPFNTKNLSEFHSHLFSQIVAIAAPSADGTFNERYAYVLNANGSVVVGKYTPDSLLTNQPVIGWGPWSGVGAVSWVHASAANVLFTTSYFGAGLVEILDDTLYLDASLFVNNLPVPFTPPAGLGPLWFIAGQSVTLMDQGSRPMGTYQVDANGFIAPQNNGGENLLAATLVAGQSWTGIAEPFCPDAQPGTDVGQRMAQRQVAEFRAYVLHSTGFMLAWLFCGRQTRTSPPLGTPMQQRRFPAYNVDDDATQPPSQRETAESIRPTGSSYDPRVAVIWDTPGPLEILELGIECSV